MGEAVTFNDNTLTLELDGDVSQIEFQQPNVTPPGEYQNHRQIPGVNGTTQYVNVSYRVDQPRRFVVTSSPGPFQPGAQLYVTRAYITSCLPPL